MTGNHQRQQAPAPGTPVVWSEERLRHGPGGEVWLGVREPGTELPDRASVILPAGERRGEPDGRPARYLTYPPPPAAAGTERCTER